DIRCFNLMLHQLLHNYKSKSITLVQLQLLGTISWVCLFFKLPTSLLNPLFTLLTKGKHPSYLISVSQEANQAIQLIKIPFNVQGLSLLLLPTPPTPTGVLAVLSLQRVYLVELLYLSHGLHQNIYPYIQALAELCASGHSRLTLVISAPLQLINLQSFMPLKHAFTIFMDGGKTLGLARSCNISLSQAQQIVAACLYCAGFSHILHSG
ncbi:hypothetical protein E2320_022551, partial [Naja naja]